MNVGKMRYRIEIKVFSSSKDKDGFISKDWKTKAHVWADVVPVSGREYISAMTETEEITYKVYIRYRSDIDNTMCVFWNERILEIKVVLGDQRSGMLTLLCKEVS